MKVIIIDHEPYSLIKKKRYSIEDFREDNFDIEYWSVCSVLPYLKNVSYASKVKEDGVIYFDSYNQLLKKIKTIDEQTVVILEVWFQWETIRLFWLLKRHNVKFVRIDYFINVINVFSNKDSKFTKFMANLSFLKLYKLTLGVIKRKTLEFVEKVFKLNKELLVFLTGREFSTFYIGSNRKSITYFDVDFFNEIRNLNRLIDEKYIVFLDIYIVNHPDLRRANLVTINADTYYHKMNAFFDKIEKELNLKVVIASHPQADYSLNPFGDRICISGKTAQLVKDSEFVITHGSSSINLAILAQKPILYVYMNEFLTSKNYLSVIYGELKNAAKYFNTQGINIDLYDGFDYTWLNVDKTAYEVFLDKHVYSLEYPKTNYEILKESLGDISS